MKIFSLPLTALLALCPTVLPAQVRLGISLGLPVAPRMELIAPGIQVVAGFPEEVFVQGGWYWCRRPDGWYRSRNGQAHFNYVETRRVPRGLVRMPEGRYRDWHRDGRERGYGNDDRRNGHDNGRGRGRGRGHDRH